MTNSTSLLVRTTPSAAPADAASARPTLGSRLGAAGLPALGLVGGLLSSLGLSGIGDAPDPHDSAPSMAAHFLLHRDDILMAAPLGYLGAAALTAFAVGVGRRVHRGGARTTGVVLAAAGVAASCYLAFLHVVYTSLAYQVAGSSPEATKALFVPTIMATPAFALATSALLGSAAYGAYRTGALPRWLSATSAVGAVVAAVGVFGYAETGYLYPDVQQQWVGNALLLWAYLTGGTLVVRALRGRAVS
jgi:hypothetical protein